MCVAALRLIDDTDYDSVSLSVSVSVSDCDCDWLKTEMLKNYDTEIVQTFSIHFAFW